VSAKKKIPKLADRLPQTRPESGGRAFQWHCLYIERCRIEFPCVAVVPLLVHRALPDRVSLCGCGAVGAGEWVADPNSSINRTPAPSLRRWGTLAAAGGAAALAAVAAQDEMPHAHPAGHAVTVWLPSRCPRADLTGQMTSQNRLVKYPVEYLSYKTGHSIQSTTGDQAADRC
jgi:hypothetical protein